MLNIRTYLKAKQSRLRQLFTDTQALTKLSPLELGYVPWTSFALKPTVMAQIVNEVVINDRRSIVEFGAGISTLYLAKIAQQRKLGEPTVITSIEDDADWADVVHGMLRERNLHDHVKMIVAPLKACSFSIDNLAWYDEKVVAEALMGQRLDLAIVDGPKAFEKGKELARFPAFHAISSNLNARCAVVLDDTNRAGEQRVLELWQKDEDFDLKIKRSDFSAFCYRGSHFGTM